MNKKFKIQFAGSIFVFVLALSFAGVVSAESKEASPSATTITPPPSSVVQATVPAASKIRVIESDTNKDGKPDRFEHYGEDGVLTSIDADTNGDGKPDEWATVENGKITKVAKDTDFDGKADKWVTYY